jgi:hypothetical protein
MSELPYAEDIGHYWQTGASSPDVWIEKALKIIKEVGGEIIQEAFGSAMGRGAYMITFEIGKDRFKVMWPVLPSRTGRDAAARRQAATLLFYDIKAKAISASVLGTKAAFFSYFLLPDGRAASEAAVPELMGMYPHMLTTGENNV